LRKFQAVCLPTALVGYYDFSGTILDASGSNNRLAQVKTAGNSATTDRFGTSSGAF